MSKDIPQAVKELATARDFRDVEYMCQWHGYTVYHIWNKSTVKRYCGIPMHALVDNEGNARYATAEENHDIVLSA